MESYLTERDKAISGPYKIGIGLIVLALIRALLQLAAESEQ